MGRGELVPAPISNQVTEQEASRSLMQFCEGDRGLSSRSEDPKKGWLGAHEFFLRRRIHRAAGEGCSFDLAQGHQPHRRLWKISKCCYLDSPNLWRGRYRCSPGLTSLFATRRSSPTAMGASRPGVSLLRLFLSPAHLFWRIHTIHARCPKAAGNRGS
ncbi:Hypothetical predicted protein [Marmota monax]|uniref:Uncharacterized protein n=1 Tax=Marmota monax TaxID=9995 RepID=A0A5E4CGP9_MARMO|nr:Hypothetical predicted protein [Marmota monax]